MHLWYSVLQSRVNLFFKVKCQLDYFQLYTYIIYWAKHYRKYHFEVIIIYIVAVGIMHVALVRDAEKVSNLEREVFFSVIFQRFLNVT